MAEPLTFTCSCGASHWHLAPKALSDGTRLKCYCKDCQAYLHHLGHADDLDDAGGSEIFQTLPQYLDISGVGEKLAALKIKKGGATRWYTDCCNTPICNTASGPKFAFVGMLTAPADTDEHFGKLRGQVQVPSGNPTREFGMPYIVRKIFSRLFKARLTGSWKQNPLFDTATLQPKVEPHRLTQEEIAAAYAK